MKTSIALGLLSSILCGCAALPQSDHNIGVKGLLICEPTELCPVVSVDWNKYAKDRLNINIRLDSSQQRYEIEKISFDNMRQTYVFSPDALTKQEWVLRRHSSTTNIFVPNDLIKKLQGSRIRMNIYTNQGVISRYIYKDGQESLLYQQFKMAYAQ